MNGSGAENGTSWRNSGDLIESAEIKTFGMSTDASGAGAVLAWATKRTTKHGLDNRRPNAYLR